MYSKTVQLRSDTMDYVVFGTGNKPLVILVGLEDGLKTVRGSGLILARFFSALRKQFRVYVFSRRNHLPKDYTIRQMATDQHEAMNLIGIEKAAVLGISMGGMIAQWLAIDYPETVTKLVIAISASKSNPAMNKLGNEWITLAEQQRLGELIVDSLEKTFTETYIKRYRSFYPVIRKLKKTKSIQRFIIQANACLRNNSYNELHKIDCPTLVIGGTDDQVVGPNTSQEMAEKIPNCQLLLYEGVGHGAFKESETFNKDILSFLLNN
ncbi:alpha/beta fold hydrolase [Anaerobacillus sp. MEB173]|uniref:alpha/beta fold hydrolase n=1 Tax=Anaerobacillus sp. MEB173 TaxID=3383345 RepID=UPI003F92FDC0